LAETHRAISCIKKRAGVVILIGTACLRNVFRFARVPCKVNPSPLDKRQQRANCLHTSSCR
jgi:hypothetical protein